MIDQLGGWSNKTVGQGYGEGFEVKILSDATTAIALRSFK
jgi:hypothetical protein